MPSPTVVLLPMWAPGHFSSMLQAWKRLLLCSRRPRGGTEAFSLTVLVMPPPMDSTSSEATSQAASGDDGIVFHHLPAVQHPTDRSIYQSDYIRLFAPHVKEAIAGLAAPVAAVVFDFFATTLLDIAHDLALPAYVYFTSTAAMFAFMLRSPAICDEEFAARLREKEGAVDMPGMPPVPVTSLPSPELSDYAWFVYYGRRFMEARGIVVNTATELEPGVLASLADGRCTPGAPPVYPIGPVLSQKPQQRSAATDRSPAPPRHECVRWLDGQPPASVVFLCFGSMGWMDVRQVREVAAGLERSGQSFLWVLRGPPPAAGNGASLYPTPTDADLGDLLPDGFLERTEGTGLVWPTWAPQSEILAHASVGGFVTHCGWNSVLESLWHGVPMAPWPMYAEQPLNAFELVASMGVAVELSVRDSFVEAAELERAVRSLMGGSEEGRKAREKAMEMKAACRKAVEEGGSSYAAAQEVVQDILRSYGSSRDNPTDLVQSRADLNVNR